MYRHRPTWTTEKNSKLAQAYKDEGQNVAYLYPANSVACVKPTGSKLDLTRTIDKSNASLAGGKTAGSVPRVPDL
jgi:hypothetical protein